IGSRRGESAALNSLGRLHHAQARPQQALACLDEALAIQRELQLRPQMVRTLDALADVQAATGDPAAAARSRQEARTLAQALGMPDDRAGRPAAAGSRPG
ncbi:MAG TPA: tetratricopeptide repeat protein, partial [Actinomycetota bacterium]|nr:tetratricopeptide repeat protein [Actinomycetota bacterium]